VTTATMTNNGPFDLLPAAHSTIAPQYDTLYNFLWWMSVVLFILIVGAAMYFAYRYRRRAGDEHKLSSPTFHSTSLEVFWSFGPLLVCLGLFHWGVKQYMDERVAPAGALEVRVTGQKWNWMFEYANGKTSDDLHVPVGRPVKLVMSSKDVIHDFSIPAYRIKQDVVPGRYTMLWFEPTHVGTEQVFCAEYCGLSHSNMLANIVAEPQDVFDKWINEDPDKTLPLAEVGQKVWSAQCKSCHSTDGSAIVGPTWKGLYGRSEQMANGQTITADDNYIRESILNPGAKIVKGYQNLMPAFQGSLKERQVDGLIEYMKTLK
jgi:cytochrome c oxidase subunit 2